MERAKLYCYLWVPMPPLMPSRTRSQQLERFHVGTTRQGGSKVVFCETYIRIGLVSLPGM